MVQLRINSKAVTKRGRQWGTNLSKIHASQSCTSKNFKSHLPVTLLFSKNSSHEFWVLIMSCVDPSPPNHSDHLALNLFLSQREGILVGLDF